MMLMVTRRNELISFVFIISAGYFNCIVDTEGLVPTTNRYFIFLYRHRVSEICENLS